MTHDVTFPLIREGGRLVGTLGHAAVEVIEDAAGPRLVLRPRPALPTPRVEVDLPPLRVWWPRWLTRATRGAE
jgi:hypothetical protein